MISRQIQGLWLIVGIVLLMSIGFSTVRAAAPMAKRHFETPPTGRGRAPIYAPLISTATAGLRVNPRNRAESVAFFQAYYNVSNLSTDWNGDHTQCNAGTTSAAFQESVALRINYFRAMAGVPATIEMSADYSAKAQQAAFLMSVNRRLSHSPDAGWQCYTATGAEGAGASNLFLEVYGADAITGYIADGGGGNFPVGHRRWLLYPHTLLMGTGDLPAQNGYPAANALWVFDDAAESQRPATRDPYVAWPPPGYVPYQVVFPQWSFSYPLADFSGARVTMSQHGTPIAVTQQPVVDGFGENTLAWAPAFTLESVPTADVRYNVQVQNVLVNGTPQNFSYDVIIINP